MSVLLSGTGVAFDLPQRLSATEPPEARGLMRNEVRLLVAYEYRVEHARFDHLVSFLSPGDLVVVNTSATVPAAMDGSRNGEAVVVHLSTPLDDGTWVIELRSADERHPILDAQPGEHVQLDGGVLEILRAYPGDARTRLVIVRPRLGESVSAFLARAGRPITYGNLHARWPLGMYQTVFARNPGSAEMPSAGRPFTHAMVTELVASGIVVAPITLHTGVSSQEAGEVPTPERMIVPSATARLVNLTMSKGGRVIAVGTTVTRALETAVTRDGWAQPFDGWTELVLDGTAPTRVVDGLITGWHPPRASHLMLLEAVAGTALVQRAYDSAIAGEYLWHEFGDSCLLLPSRSSMRPSGVTNLHKT